MASRGVEGHRLIFRFEMEQRPRVVSVRPFYDDFDEWFHFSRQDRSASEK